MAHIDFIEESKAVGEGWSRFEGQGYKSVGGAKRAVKRIICDDNGYFDDRYEVVLYPSILDGRIDVDYRVESKTHQDINPISGEVTTWRRKAAGI